MRQSTAARQSLEEKVASAAAAFGPEGPACAGVAFVTFSDAHDAVWLLERGTIALPSLADSPFAVARPPEPSDVIWENLGCDDAPCRQVIGTLAMLALSLVGAGAIGASAYLQPKVRSRTRLSAGRAYTHTSTHTDTQTHRHTDTQTHRHTDTSTHARMRSRTHKHPSHTPIPPYCTHQRAACKREVQTGGTHGRCQQVGAYLFRHPAGE